MKKATRECLLECAAKAFAEKGYNATKTQDICKEAKANVAAVNYHFGGKEELYREVWDYAVKHAMEDYSAVTSQNEDREWLYNYLRVCVLAIFDTGPSGLLRRLVANEMNDPSPYAEEMLSEHLSPRIHDLDLHLRRMLGPNVTDFQVECCILAIHSQFATLTINKSTRRKLFTKQTPTEEEATHFTREICAFVMGGIRAMRTVPPQARRSIIPPTNLAQKGAK